MGHPGGLLRRSQKPGRYRIPGPCGEQDVTELLHTQHLGIAADGHQQGFPLDVHALDVSFV